MAHPMRVAGQILEHVFRTAKRGLGIDDPVPVFEIIEELAEPVWCGQFQAFAVKGEFLLLERLG